MYTQPEDIYSKHALGLLGLIIIGFETFDLVSHRVRILNHILPESSNMFAPLIRSFALDIHKTLSAISPYFSIAAGFGNVHGVYKPGNVKLHPELLGKHQAYVKEQTGSKDDKPAFLVFHGGSGSSKAEYIEAISHGVVKVNLDTDLQYAYLTGIRDYVLKKKDYIMSQVGNPEGEDKPNKKYFDPRVWVREGEKTMSARVQEGMLGPSRSFTVEVAFASNHRVS